MSREARVGDAALYPNEDGLIERRLFLWLGSESPRQNAHPNWQSIFRIDETQSGMGNINITQKTLAYSK